MTPDPVLAYHNEDFLDTDDGRPLRILAEYIQPLQAFRKERVHRHGDAVLRSPKG